MDSSDAFLRHIGFGARASQIFRGYLDSQYSLRSIVQSFCAPSDVPKIGDPISIRVDGALTLDERILLGCYDVAMCRAQAASEIVLTGTALIKEVFLIPFAWRYACRSVGGKMQGLAELLALGAQYPELQRYCTIVAAGTSRVVSGEDLVVSPGLGMREGKRILGEYQTDVTDSSCLLLVSTES